MYMDVSVSVFVYVPHTSHVNMGGWGDWPYLAQTRNGSKRNPGSITCVEQECWDQEFAYFHSLSMPDMHSYELTEKENTLSVLRLHTKFCPFLQLEGRRILSTHVVRQTDKMAGHLNPVCDIMAHTCQLAG